MLRTINFIILVIGITCIGFGSYVAFITVQDFHLNSDVWGIHFGKSATLQDLGTALSGTAGVLFTIAGVAFFTVSLLQTSSEMRQTRNLISTQLAQSTFFNLVKAQRELLLSDDYEKFVESLKRTLSTFRGCVEAKKFKNFNQTTFSPEPLYYDDYKKLHVVAKSLINVSDFIKTELNDNAFYHRTFYLGMSEAEQFLLGLVRENDLENSLSYSFDYHEHFDNTSPFVNTIVSPYFPPLYFDGFNCPTFAILNAADPVNSYKVVEEKTKFEIRLMDEPDLTLKKIYYNVSYMLYAVDSEKIVIQESKFVALDPKNLNLWPFFRDCLWQLLSVSDDIDVHLNFIFDYKGTEFEIGGTGFHVKTEFADVHNRYGLFDEMRHFRGKFPGGSIKYVFISTKVS